MRTPARKLGIALALSAGLLLLAAGPAAAAYESVSGGTATPSSIAAGGGTDYSVSIEGGSAVVDIALVLDTSGSMSESFTSGTRWDVVRSAAQGFVGDLGDEGFFARGGKLAVVFYADGAVTGTAPTSSESAITTALNSVAPNGQTCIGCGLEKAADLLAAIPGSAGHRRIAYVVGDGANTVTPPMLADAIATANAAHLERRAIQVAGSSVYPDLEAVDSSGSVTHVTTAPEMGPAFAAEPTKFPGATNLSWAFHLSPGFTASAPAATAGGATTSGTEVVWTIPALGEETATLSFHATHSATSGCAATSLLTGTTFTDAEGDPVPSVGLGALAATGCPVAISPIGVGRPEPPATKCPKGKQPKNGRCVAKKCPKGKKRKKGRCVRKKQAHRSARRRV